MLPSQPGILPPVPPLGRYLEFALLPDADPRDALSALQGQELDDTAVVGLGPAVATLLGAKIDGLRPFPALNGPGCSVPSSQADLWLWLRGDDHGDLLHTGRRLQAALATGFRVDQMTDGFRYAGGRDLTGYEDGTENPEGDAAVAAAIVQGRGAGQDGASFAAVQLWEHDLDHFEDLPQGERDHIIGRRLSDNEELDDAPASAHVKRTAQESFDPEAFVLRRSMPWADSSGCGLMFVAFGKSPDAFEAQMRRMVGEEDGITDGLFRFSRPLSGSYFWCPPVEDGRLDLSALGL